MNVATRRHTRPRLAAEALRATGSFAANTSSPAKSRTRASELTCQIVAHVVLAAHAVRRARHLIVLAERRREVHDAGAGFRRHPIGGEHRHRGREVVERRHARQPRELGAEAALALDVAGELVAVAGGIREPHRLAVAIAIAVGTLEAHVDERRVHRERGVRRQRPRCRRPREQRRARAGDAEPHRQREIDARAIRVVEARLEVRQRGLTARAVRDDLLAFVDEAAPV